LGCCGTVQATCEQREEKREGNEEEKGRRGFGREHESFNIGEGCVSDLSFQRLYSHVQRRPGGDGVEGEGKGAE